jgi:DNA primase
VGKGTVGRGFFQNARYHIEGKVTEFVAKSDTSDACVIVEDCLSAIRVCDAGVTAVALLGTYLKESTWVLLQSYKRFLVWLDDDNPQVKLAQTKIGQRLSQIGPTRVVRGNREPKLLTNSEISDTVNTL